MRANIIVMAGNFHGRTTTIIASRDDPDARDDFGPFTPGFRIGAVRRRRRRSRRRSTRTPSRCWSSRSRARPASSCRPADYLPAVRELTRERERAASSPTRSSRASAAPGATFACELRRASCPTCTCSARRSAAASCRSRAVVGDRDVLGVLQPGRARLDLRRQPARRGRRPRGRRACSRPASSQARARDARRAPARPPRARSSATASSRCAAPASGPASTSTRRSAPDARCARLLMRARRAREGHARLDHPARAADRGRAGRPRLGGRPARGGARRAARLALARLGRLVLLDGDRAVRGAQVEAERPSESFGMPTSVPPFDVSVDTR